MFQLMACTHLSLYMHLYCTCEALIWTINSMQLVLPCCMKYALSWMHTAAHLSVACVSQLSTTGKERDLAWKWGSGFARMTLEWLPSVTRHERIILGNLGQGVKQILMQKSGKVDQIREDCPKIMEAMLNRWFKKCAQISLDLSMTIKK